MTIAIWVQIGLALVGLLSSTVIGVIGFLLNRTLTQIDKNQSELFVRLHKLEEDFYEVRGEHKRNHLSDMTVRRSKDA